ncbi:PREDICTED: uncharacterized protein LOC105556743, partial [Vollenhovia emeryi]|uniref:uncharacterized protein LOC105556743 n=1 Tax=Vollenhovia emeryi TaxID=411798 RepID=UPI0005F41E9D
MENIDPIRYYWHDNNTSQTNTIRTLRSRNINNAPYTPIKYSKLPLNEQTHNTTGKIEIYPNNFQVSSISSPLQLQHKWLKNLTDAHIPEHIQGLIQLRSGFCLPISNNKDTICFEFIKRIEASISKLDLLTISNIRNHTNTILSQWYNNPQPLREIGKKILKTTQETKTFFKSNPELLITKADKGNVTVIIHKTEYNKKMNDMLGDSETYSLVQRDPTNKILKNLTSLLTRWRDKNFISQGQYRNMYASDGVLPRAYGLPKIHKPNIPLRIIVSSVYTPLYNIATFLQDILQQSLPSNPTTVKDSFTLVESLRNTYVPAGVELISLDVVSLFTNIPLDLAINSVKKRWNFISKKTKIPLKEFIEALQFVLHSTYFTFENNIYKQNYGCPMGSPLSPVISEIVLQDVETTAIKKLKFHMPFYCRYVDDIALAAPPQFFNDILKTFNSIHKRMQFTMEIGENHRLNFLD